MVRLTHLSEPRIKKALLLPKLIDTVLSLSFPVLPLAHSRTILLMHIHSVVG
jgi:hypothetical protein